MSLNLDIAWRFAAARASILAGVSRLALLGLVLSVAVLVIVLSVVNGFERELRERILGVIPNVSVEFNGGVRDEDRARLDQIIESESGFAAWAEKIQASVLLANVDSLYAAQVVGIDPARYAAVSGMSRFTAADSLDALGERPFTVVLGQGLAERLGVEVGDRIRIIVPAVAVGPAGVVPRQKRVEVVGLFRSDSLLDASTAYMNIAGAARLLRLSRSPGVHMKMDDLLDLSMPRFRLGSAFGDRVRVRTWADSYGNLYQAIAVQKATMFVLLLFLVSVAAFNLVSGLVMMVEQRRADVAVLQTLGFNGRGTLSVFMLLGLMVALAGIVLGVLLGVLVTLTLPEAFRWLNEASGGGLMSQYFIAYLPTEIRPGDLAVISAVALLLASIATAFPAFKATRIKPSRVLAHE